MGFAEATRLLSGGGPCFGAVMLRGGVADCIEGGGKSEAAGPKYARVVVGRRVAVPGAEPV